MQSVPHGSNSNYTEVGNLKFKSDAFLVQFLYEPFAIIAW